MKQYMAACPRGLWYLPAKKVGDTFRPAGSNPAAAAHAYFAEKIL